MGGGELRADLQGLPHVLRLDADGPPNPPPLICCQTCNLEIFLNFLVFVCQTISEPMTEAIIDDFVEAVREVLEEEDVEVAEEALAEERARL